MGLAWCGYTIDAEVATHSLILLLKKKLERCQADKDRGEEPYISAYNALEHIKLFFTESDSGAESPSAFFKPLTKEVEPREDTSEWPDIFEWNIREELEVCPSLNAADGQEMIELCEGTHIDSSVTLKKLSAKLKHTYMALQSSFDSVRDLRKELEECRARLPTFNWTNVVLENGV